MSQVFKNTGLIHSYIQYPIGLRDPIELLHLGKSIRDQHFDLMIYLQDFRRIHRVLRDIIYFRFCGIPKIIGTPYKKRYRRPIYIGQNRFEYTGNRLLRCLGSLGNKDVNNLSSFDLGIGNRENSVASEILKHSDISPPYIVISIGTKVDVNDWGKTKWAKFISKLGKHVSVKGLVVIGSASERKVSSELLSFWPGKSTNLCGQTSVLESAAILSRASVFIGHDSGPMHLSAAVGTPCVGIFSSRNLPGEWFPAGLNHKILYKDIPCKGCRLTICNQHNKKCIESISVNEVLESTLDTLNRRLSASLN